MILMSHSSAINKPKNTSEYLLTGTSANHFIKQIFILDSESLSYRDGVDLASKFSNASEEGIDLLKKMLCFNPYFRITVDECLSHPFFASIRDLDNETCAKKEIAFSFENEGDLSESRLRELILQEVDHFNK